MSLPTIQIYNTLDAKNTPTTPVMGYSDVSAKFLKEEGSDFFKSIYTIIDWITHYDFIPEGQEKVFADARGLAKTVKCSHYFGKLADKANKLRHKLIIWFQGPKEGKDPVTWSQIAFAINQLVNPIWNIADLFTRVVFEISKDSVEWLRGTNGVALIIGMGKSACESISNIHDLTIRNKMDEKSHWELSIKLIKEIAYVILGAMTVAIVFGGASITTWALTKVATVALVCQIVGYYQTHLGTTTKPKN